jgi:hypothetical protein
VKARRIRWLGLIVALAFAVRLVALAGVYYVKPTGTVFLDDRSYHNRAWDVAGSLKKGVLVSAYDAKETSLKAVFQDPIVSFYPYWVAGLYLVFGSHVLVAQVGNILVSLGMIGLVFLLGRTWFSEPVGLGAAFMFAVWPSLVFWSVLNLKDVLVWLVGYTCVWIGLRLIKRPVGPHLVLTFPLVWLLFHLNVRLWMVLLVWLFLCAVMSEGGWRWKFIPVVGVCLLGATFLWTPFVRDRIIREVLFGDPGKVVRVHQEAAKRGVTPLRAGRDLNRQAQAGGQAGDPYSGVAKGTFSGVRLLLFSPLPWNAVNRAQRLAGFETILFVVVFLLSIWGFIGSVKNAGSRKAFWLQMIFLVAMIFMYGAFEGNAGTAFRHRGVLLPGFFLFAVAGMQDVKDRISGRVSPC